MLHALAEHLLQLVFAPRLAAAWNIYAKLMGKPQKAQCSNAVHLKAEADQAQCELPDKLCIPGAQKGLSGMVSWLLKHGLYAMCLLIQYVL